MSKLLKIISLQIDLNYLKLYLYNQLNNEYVNKDKDVRVLKLVP